MCHETNKNEEPIYNIIETIDYNNKTIESSKADKTISDLTDDRKSPGHSTKKIINFQSQNN